MKRSKKLKLLGIILGIILCTASCNSSECIYLVKGNITSDTTKVTQIAPSKEMVNTYLISTTDGTTLRLPVELCIDYTVGDVISYRTVSKDYAEMTDQSLSFQDGLLSLTSAMIVIFLEDLL